MSNNMFRWEIDGQAPGDRVLVLTMDDPGQSQNTMNELFGVSLSATVERLEAERDTFDGVIVTSAKDSFFAGGDLEHLMNAGPDDVPAISAQLDHLKDAFRRIETLASPSWPQSTAPRSVAASRSPSPRTTGSPSTSWAR